MSVDRTEISKFQCFKQITAFAYETLDAVFDLTSHFTAEMSADRQFSKCFPDIVLEFIIKSGKL